MASNTRLQLTSPPESHEDQLPKLTGDDPGSAKSFLDLPAEMRNMIYHHLFPEGESAVQLLTRNGGKGFIAMSDRLGLLATCRQIYEETTGFLRGAGRTNVRKSKTLHEMVEATMNPWFHSPYTTSPILSLILPTAGITLAFDLDKKTLRRHASKLMYTSKAFRQICIINAESVEISATLTTDLTESNFNGFHVLRQWIDDGHADILQYHDVVDLNGLFILSYDLASFTELEDLRFDVTAFVGAIKPCRVSDCRVLVRVQHDDGGDWSQTTSVTGLHERLLVFLWRLIEHYPELRTDACPQVWFDGLLWPQEAEFADKAGEGGLCIKTRDVGFSREKQAEDCDEAWDAIIRGWALAPDYKAGSLVGVAVNLAQRIGDEPYW